MDLDEIKRGLRAEIKKRENEQYFTFQCNVRQMCKDVLAKLEEQESEIAELKQKLENVQASMYCDVVDANMENFKLERKLRYHKYKRCLAMAKWCEATSLWCYQAANTLPAGFHATLHGKPVMIEPERLFKRSALLTKWNTRWLKLAEKFKEAK